MKAKIPFLSLSSRVSLNALVLTSFLPFCSPVTAQPSSIDPWTMRDMMGRGVNMKCSLDGTYGWWDAFNVAIPQKIAATGFTSVRVWAAFEASKDIGPAPDYTLRSGNLAALDAIVDGCLAQNLVVLLNLTQRDSGINNADAVAKAKFLKVWEQLAGRYANRSPKLVFNILNEPNGPLTTEILNGWYADVTPIIRATNPTRILLYNGGGYANAATLKDMVVPASAGAYYMGNCHIYPPMSFTHGGTMQWVGSDEQKATPLARIRDAEDWVQRTGKPMTVTEWGGNNKRPVGERAAYAQFLKDEFEARGFAWQYFTFNNENDRFAIYNADTDSWMHPQIRDVLISGTWPYGNNPPPPPPPYIGPGRIEAGSPDSFTDGAGNEWDADAGFVGGSVVDRGAISIAGTNDDRIYQTERYGMTSYRAYVPDGSYTVNLHFAETWTGISSAGQRVFTVTAEGVSPAGWANIDVFAGAGGRNVALVKTATVSVADGQLDLGFVANAGQPMVNGIEILPVNQPPSVTLTAPANGATLIEGSTVDLQAVATDPDGSVAVVSFFVGGVSLIGEDTSVPYSASWVNLEPGAYTLTAVATDNMGASAVSAAISVTVVPATVAIPYRIEAGGEANFIDGMGSTWIADQYFSGGLTVDRGSIAIANTVDDRLYQTERYGMYGYNIPVNNGVYTVRLHFAETWAGITAAGQRVFGVSVEGVTPAAWSNLDVFAQTGGRNIALVGSDQFVVEDGVLNIAFTPIVRQPIVNAIEILANAAPAVALTAPTQGAVIVLGETATLAAAASDPDGQVAVVEFYRDGDVFLGNDGTSPYVTSWTPTTVGSYSLTARAHDNHFASSTSAPVAVTVTAANREAETANRSGGFVSTREGVIYVDMPNAGSGWIEWVFDAPVAGTYSLKIRYANGGSTNRTGTTSINGGSGASRTFTPTGAWTTWADLTFSASLNAGVNTIRLTATNGPDVDRLQIANP